MTHRSYSAVIVSLALSAGCLPAAADWRQFRGNDNTNISTEKNIPITWTDTENTAWKIPLPGRGASGPIVVGDKVIVTCSSGPTHGRMHIVCYSTNTGKQVWHRQFWATGRTLSHPSSCNASPTPASDGRHVFAFYSSNDLVCLDLDGNLIWYRGLAHDYPAAGNDVGMASSPLVIGNTVIVQVENQGNSFAAGIDTATGKTRWRKPRDRTANWASPIVWRGAVREKDRVLLQSPASGMVALDPYSGEQRWKFKTTCPGIPSAVVAGEVILLPSNGVTALRPEADADEPEVLWQSGRLNLSGASPVTDQGRLYVLSRSVLNCADAKTGKQIWQLRLAGGRYWATPVAINNHLYVINYDGKVQVVKIGADVDQGKIVGRSDFGEMIQASPAVSGGAMYVRSDGHLWKISKN